MNYYFTLICGIISISQGSCYLEHDNWIRIEMQHALDSSDAGRFTHRGNVTIPSLFEPANAVQNDLLESELDYLKKLATDNDYYRLRLIINYQDGIKYTLLTSVKACMLLKSQLSDVLWVSLDSNGFVTAVSQTISTSETPDCSHDSISASLTDNFNTDVVVKHIELGPIPDTAGFIQKLEREREARERGEVHDNRGFFAKYWMYIVPVAVFVFLSGATNQEAGK